MTYETILVETLGKVGLIRTVLPCHDITLVFHHGLITQWAKTCTEKFID